MTIQLDSRSRNRLIRLALFPNNPQITLACRVFLALFLVLGGAFQTPAQVTKASVPSLPPPGGVPGSQQYCTNLGNSISNLQKAYNDLSPGQKNDDQTQENYNSMANGYKYDWEAHGCGGLVKISGCTDQNLCPPDSLPSSSGKTVELGGAVNIPFSAFDLGSAPRKPILTKPFTANELLAVAPAGRISTSNLGQFVKTKAGTLIPIGTYVAQLNSMETFLNQYGYTLRDGALAGRPGGNMVASNLGLQFKLRSLQPPTNALSEQTIGTTPFPPHMPSLTYSPLKQPEYINFPTTNLGQMVKQQPNQIDVTGYTFAPRVSQLATGIVPSDPPHPAPDSTVPQDNHCTNGGGASCGLTFGSNVTLGDQGAVLLAHCNTSDGTCSWFPWWFNGFPGDGFAVAAPDVIFFMENYTDVCAVVAKLGVQTASMLYNLPEDYTSGSSHGVTSVQGTNAPNFFDGVLEAETDQWHPCKYLNGGLNDWFGGSVCLAYDSKNYYHPGPGFDITESAGVTAEASIFGQAFTLLNGTSSSEWKQTAGVVNTQTVSDPWTQTSLDPSDNGEQFDGPSAYFTIGPVPFSIKSSLYAGIRVGDTTNKFVAPPVNKNQSGPAGDIGVSINAEANATVTISAGVDIGIASAGVYGALTLFDHKIDGGIESIIDPTANSLLIKQSTDWTLNSMSGELGAYVEVDLLVYSKRWDVELAHFDGYTETVPVANYTAGPYHAKIPATATQSCN